MVPLKASLPAHTHIASPCGDRRKEGTIQKVSSTASLRGDVVLYLVQQRGGKGWHHTSSPSRQSATASKPSAPAKEEHFLDQDDPSVNGSSVLRSINVAHCH